MKHLLFGLLVIVNAAGYSQGITDCSKLSALINFDEIWQKFRFKGQADSVILIDKNGVILSNCQLELKKCKLRLTHDTTLIKHAIKDASVAYFRENYHYFVFDDFKQIGDEFTFLIFQACSNDYVNCKVLKDADQFKLISYRYGTW